MECTGSSGAALNRYLLLILRESLSGLSTEHFQAHSPVRSTARRRAQRHHHRGLPAVAMARRILELTHQINDLRLRITQVITAHAPQLPDHYGLWPDTAATLLIIIEDSPNDCTARPPSPSAVSAPRQLLARDPTPTAQPQWGPASTLRLLHRFVPVALGHPQPPLRPTTHRRRQDPPRSDPLPQTLPCREVYQHIKPRAEPTTRQASAA